MSTLYRGRKPGGLRNRGAHVMTQLGRVELHKVAEIPASAKEVCALLTDWAGMLRWSQSAERGGGPLGALVGCELVGDRDQIPRTRRMILDSGVAVEEELFYQNDETKRIYYRKNDAFGTVGYIATSWRALKTAGILGRSLIPWVGGWGIGNGSAAGVFRR
jgi:hypothetical protein